MHTMAIRVAGIAQLNNTTVGTIHASQLKVNKKTALGGGNIASGGCDCVHGEVCNSGAVEGCDSGASW